MPLYFPKKGCHFYDMFFKVKISFLFYNSFMSRFNINRPIKPCLKGLTSHPAWCAPIDVTYSSVVGVPLLALIHDNSCVAVNGYISI